MTVKVVLVVEAGEAGDHYASLLAPLDVDVTRVETLTALHEALVDTPHHGILLDLRTKIHASGEEKMLVHYELQQYPVLTLRWDQARKQCTTTVGNRSHSVENFIAIDCAKGEARSLRGMTRLVAHFNLIVEQLAEGDHRALDLNSNESGEHSRLSEVTGTHAALVHTATLNVSMGGCFVFMANPPELGKKVRLYFQELTSPMVAEVRWVRAWGEARECPGIGVQFIDPPEGVPLELMHLAASHDTTQTAQPASTAQAPPLFEFDTEDHPVTPESTEEPDDPKEPK